MKELSLNILDIAQNSIAAEADIVEISIVETADTLTLTVADNGCGMSGEFLARVQNPFATSRTTRKVGMGIPLLKLAAEQTGGTIEIESRERSEYPDCSGTRITAVFNKNHVDFTPLGDIVSTVTALIQGCPEVDYVFSHKLEDREIHLDTRQMRAVLGSEVPLNDAAVLVWVNEMLNEQYA